MNDTTGKPDESTILDHMESPYHRGRAPNASCAHTERNAACGDWVRLELVLKTMVYSLCLTTGAESHEPREEQ